jgi:hypothetical protein
VKICEVTGRAYRTDGQVLTDHGRAVFVGQHYADAHNDYRAVVVDALYACLREFELVPR